MADRPAPSLSEEVGQFPPLVVRDDLVRASGQIAAVRHMIMPAWMWLRREESQDPAWGVIDFGPYVVAYRVTL